EDVVAEAPVNEAGWYRARYEHGRDGEFASTSLSVRLFSFEGGLIGQSPPVLSPADRTRIDIRPSRKSPAPSEYELIEEGVSGLNTGTAALEGADESVVEEVAQWLDVDSSRLSLFQRAGE